MVVFLAGLPQSVGGVDGQPLLRLVDAGDPHGRRRDPDGRGRGVHLRRRREHEPRADDGLQPDAQPDAREPRCRRPISPWARPPRTWRAKYQITRAEQEAFAVDSQQQARRRGAGRGQASTDEIVPIATKDGMVDSDGCIRPDTTPEGLAGLKPAFDAERHGHRRHLLAADRRRRRPCWSPARTIAKAHGLADPGADQVDRGRRAARRRSWASARSRASRKALERAGLDARATSTWSS